MRRKLGECLIHEGLISEDAVHASLAEQRRTGERLGTLLVRQNLVTDRQVAKALARQLGFPYVNLSENPPDQGLAALIPRDLALRHLCVAVRRQRHELTVAMADPLLFSLVLDLEALTACRVKLVVSTPLDIREAIELGTADPPRRPAPRTRSVDSEGDEGGPAPIAGHEDRGKTPLAIDLANQVVMGAIRAGARDVHVQPEEGRVRVRYGRNDTLTDAMELPGPVCEGLVTRLKAMAGMDIAERRRPQIGRMSVTTENALSVDFRASTRRTLHGEKMVLRMLDFHTSEPG